MFKLCLGKGLLETTCKGSNAKKVHEQLRFTNQSKSNLYNYVLF